MAKDKLRMSNKRFMAILIPVLVILLVLVIGVTVAMNLFSATMNMYLGRGERQVINPEGVESWDVDYYDLKYSAEDGENGSRAAAAETAKSIADEGEVLMKNDGTLPLAKQTKVTPFGCRYISPIYGGTGSGSTTVDADFYATAEKSLKSVFQVNETVVAKMKESPVTSMTATAIKTDDVSSGNGFSGATTTLFEYDPAIYDSVASSCGDTTGIVFLGRVGGEGGDLQTGAYKDGTAHELALSSYEKGTIKFAKQHCKNVVVVLNTSNVMEISALTKGEYAVNSILWIGGPGCRGMQSMADILSGDVNPSGRLPDTWVTDLTRDPTFANFGVWNYENMKWCARNYGIEDKENDPAYQGNSLTKYKQAPFVEYEEGIYVGYKYYETADAADSSFDYAKEVVYPFGYGLSYTEFTQTITEFGVYGDDIKVTVAVENKKDTDGKEVVQLYYSAPYTDFDKQHKIEKAAKNLVAFKKVEVAAGKTEYVTLTFSKEDMASYCYTRNNDDGTKGCYVLEEGEYSVYLGKNSHESWESRTVRVDSTVWYDGNNPRQYEKDGQALLDDAGIPTSIPAIAEKDNSAGFKAATNRFDSTNDYVAKNMKLLSRADWANTQPSAPVNFVASDEVRAEYAEFDYATDKNLGNVSGSKVYAETTPKEKAARDLVISDLRGKSYYDESWERLLDQIDYSEAGLCDFLFEGAYNTGKLDSIGMEATWNLDGPQGLSIWSGFGTSQRPWCAWPSEPVIAATFNLDCAMALGESIGDEALTSKVHGWYGPGLNMHRSAFAGRNFEYFSEDSLLSGLMGAAEVSGAGNKGIFAFPKHFALNDQEADREGLLTWATEQTIREIYLKPFEMAVKNARMTIKYTADEKGTLSSKVIRGCTAIMASKNCIGADLCRSNYALLTEVLREEWGFQGFVVTDMELLCSPARHDKGLRSGLDLWMAIKGGTPQFTPIYADDITSSTAKNCIRNAVKNIAYTVANSSALNKTPPGAIIKYTMSPWAVWLLVGNIVVYGLIIGGIVWIVLRTLHSRKHPELYKSKQTV